MRPCGLVACLAIEWDGTSASRATCSTTGSTSRPSSRAARALHVPVSAIVQTAEREAEIALIVGAARAGTCASGRPQAP